MRVLMVSDQYFLKVYIYLINLSIPKQEISHLFGK